MAKAIHQSEKESFQLVTFQYGDLANPQFARYTDLTQAFEGGFVSTPTMEVDLPTCHGTLQKTTLTITMEVADAFLTRVSKLLPHSPIYVRVDDFTRGVRPGDSASILTFFRGRVVRGIRNKDGKPNLFAFQCEPAKARLDHARLGLQANTHCGWSLFGPGCRVEGLVQSIHQKLVTLDAASGKVGTITTPTFTGPVSPGGNVDHFWDRGYLEKDGLRISIRDWNIATPSTVYVRKTIPLDWVGTTVLAVPGCHKTVEDCRLVWDNEPAFGGAGYGMQDYNPLFEDPQ